MNRDEAKDYIRTRAAEYLTKASKAGYICPICNSGSGKNGTGITTKDNIHYTCWAGCFSNADIIDIIGMENNVTDYNEKLELAAREYGITIERGTRTMDSKEERAGAVGSNGAGVKPDHKENVPKADYTAYYQECMKHIEDTDYLEHRGISQETAKRFWIGFDAHYAKGTGGKTWQAVIIPTTKWSYVARNTDVTADSKDRYRKTNSSSLFNSKVISQDRPIFIVEGEIDAMSVVEAGAEAIGLGSAGNYKALVELCKTTRPQAPLLLALDKDERGQADQQKLKDELIHLQLKCYDVDIAGGYKDANEYLLADREAFIEAVKSAERVEASLIEQELESYKETYAGNHLARFIKHIQDSAMYNPISTGFKWLDKVLGGGLYAGLYVVGAVSSLGKTTFCIQLGDQVAEQGHDVLFFSLEMAEDELIARSISRETKKECIRRFGEEQNEYAKDTRGILTGKLWQNYKEADMAIITAAMTRYRTYGQRIKIVEGIGNVGVEQIREAVERHVKITGNYPVVIVDYLQILAPATDRGTDKQNTDRAVLELKKMSRDFSLPVLVVSSFNRANYNEPVNMAAFKESGAVEYSADVAIGLQYECMDYRSNENEKQRIARIREAMDLNFERGKKGFSQDVQLKVLKNRNGSRGGTELKLFPKYNYYEEKPDPSLPKTFEAMGEEVKDEEWKELD